MTLLPERGALLGTLRHRGFRQLAVGRCLTYFGNAMAPIALAFAVLDLGGSAVEVGIVVGARSIANAALLLFGGLLADRLPRALVLQGASVAAALAQAAVAATLLLGSATLPVLVLLSVVNGAVSAVSIPASAALVPQTVPPYELRAANALARMGLNAGMIAGASLGGMLTALVNPGWGLACNAVAFLAAAAGYRAAGRALARAPHTASTPEAGQKTEQKAERAHPWRELREGWTEFTSRTWVWVVVLQFFVVNAVSAGGIQVLGPTIADSTFGRTAWGFVLATQMAGALVGGVLVARSRARHALRIGVAVVALDALPLLALAQSADVVLLMAAMFVNGIAIEQFGVAWDLSLQENIPQDRLARVYSYDALGSTIALPVGEMVAGPLAERVGPRPTMLGGVALVAAVTAAALCSRDVRSLTTRSGTEPAPPSAGKAGPPEQTAPSTQPPQPEQAEQPAQPAESAEGPEATTFDRI
ncbi:MFS transporter [Streptomyces armeniacus]|uniref:MFS transporter n=1 Tax=Streptomyces armeniacus TaxID=83291 RepID=A0A345XXF9_9ACTN|nr:MFS transporter [Streptomyces armeniacus]AXK36325.1 MFS transporter [Streptomyces armeniacus]